MVCTINIQSACAIWDEPIKKTYTNKINVGSYLPTYIKLSTKLIYARLPILG
jgi:hypothetical protein